LIAVGEVERPKGYDLLLDAVQRLVSEGLALKLTIVGEGFRSAQV
jgi:glycosyltransferase involved in cell wall biosynthesis